MIGNWIAEAAVTILDTDTKRYNCIIDHEDSTAFRASHNNINDDGWKETISKTTTFVVTAAKDLIYNRCRC